VNWEDEPMRVVLEDYGPVNVQMATERDASDAGTYYNIMTRYIGNFHEDAADYAQRLESIEHYTISGVIVGGPYDGTAVQNYPVETDLTTLAILGSRGEMDGESPYERWS
jgi:hypothetical protein